MPQLSYRAYRDKVLLLFPDAKAPLTAMLGKLMDQEYEEALDRIRSGSVSPDDVRIILTYPSPASGLADE